MSSNIIKLKSSDGESFKIEEAAARKMKIIANMIEDECVDEDNAIPLENVKGEILNLIIMYCKEHVNDDVTTEAHVVVDDVATESTKEAHVIVGNIAADSTEEASAEEEAKKKLNDWDAKFMKSINFETLFEVSVAANYLNVKGLLTLTCQTIADIIKDKTVEEVREIFSIENDFSPEEEAEIRKENAWAFET